MTRGVLATIAETRRLVIRAIATAIATGATQSAIAARCCITQGELANILRGARQPRPWLLDLMADELGIEVAAEVRSIIDPMDITTGTQTVTASGPVTGTLDTSALAAAPGIRLNITAFSGTSARIAIEDTASATEFSDAQPAAVFDIAGPITTELEMHRSGFEMPSLRYGATHNQLRANVLSIAGSSPSLTLYAYTS